MHGVRESREQCARQAEGASRGGGARCARLAVRKAYTLMQGARWERRGS